MSMTYAIITGASSGLGLHFAKWLYAHGEYSIVLGCRNKEKAERALAEFQHVPICSERSHLPREVKYMQLDLTSVLSVEKFVEQFTDVCPKGALQLLVNNGGIMNHPIGKAANGVEIHFATNFLGHYVLTNQLWGYFAEKARILNITSGYYEKCNELPDEEVLISKNPPSSYRPLDYYVFSKLANCLHVVMLQRRIQQEKRVMKVVAVRPGFVRGTDLGRHTNSLLRLLATPLIWYFSKNLDQGIVGIIHCATCDYDQLESGLLYHDTNVIPYKSTSVNNEEVEELSNLGDSLTGWARENELRSIESS